jgi:threonine dehydrogenase-like Zn-dependent dehydrogenase
MNRPEEQLYWPLNGKGLDSFGVNDKPVKESLPLPGPKEVLARVDAFTICASDVKMIHMGNDYPLFKDRDFAAQPARLGHELSLTVVEPGSDMAEDWPIGKRFGVQPDVYLDGERYCIGVNVNGGMAEYILLGAEVFNSDNGSCAFSVNSDFSYASVAQTEPVACVEAAFVQHSRQMLKDGGSLYIHIDGGITKEFELDVCFKAQQIHVFDPGQHAGKQVILPANYILLNSFPSEYYDDIIILGNPTDKQMSQLTEIMAEQAILCWLPESEAIRYVNADIAKIHYNKVNLLGAATRKLSDALKSDKYRYDYKGGGDLIISGGGGAMGRIHIMRALQHNLPPRRIIITNRTRKRLDCLLDVFGETAAAKGIELIPIGLKDTPDYKQKIRQIVGEKGASDIVICAPGVDPVNDIVEYLADDGLLVLFAGTSYGHFGKIPLGLIASKQASVTASSGSAVEDQLRVIEKMEAGMINPDINIAAIAGLRAAKDGIRAVRDGIYAGKVVVYPSLTDLPLTDLCDIGNLDEDLKLEVSSNGWSKEAEHILFEKFSREEHLNE